MRKRVYAMHEKRCREERLPMRIRVIARRLGGSWEEGNAK